jgi:hypothetical protein
MTGKRILLVGMCVLFASLSKYRHDAVILGPMKFWLGRLTYWPGNGMPTADCASIDSPHRFLLTILAI